MISTRRAFLGALLALSAAPLLARALGPAVPALGIDPPKWKNVFLQYEACLDDDRTDAFILTHRAPRNLIEMVEVVGVPLAEMAELAR